MVSTGGNDRCVFQWKTDMEEVVIEDVEDDEVRESDSDAEPVEAAAEEEDPASDSDVEPEGKPHPKSRVEEVRL